MTRFDLPADDILENAKGELESVVLIGYDKKGREYIISSIANGATVMWLLERTKKLLLDANDGTY